MNYGYVRVILGRILLLEAVLLTPSLLLSVYFRESGRIQLGIAASMAVTLLMGFLMSFRPPAKKTFYAREGFVIVSLTWILLSLCGALPFFLSGADRKSVV